MKLKKLFVAALLLAAPLGASADEGMWLLQLMKQQNSIDLMKKQGLKLQADDLYNPNGVSLKDAVGIFGGGCTGEIVSPEGLILTNHHCGYGAIQQHSSVEHDYLTNGFWAKKRSDELPTPGLRFQFVYRIEDITDIVNEKIAKKEVTEYQAISQDFLDKLAQELFQKSDLRKKKGFEVEALPFYAGNRFYLFYKRVYTDVRMVAAPPQSVGKFGGETDNWMWPRHTGDFSMFRIYADKNGDPAPYSAKNVPLKTPKYLQVSMKGVAEGDYAMVMGFPGRTSRYLTVEEVKERMEAQNQPRIDIRTARLDVLKELMRASDKIRIQYASKYASSSNYWKNSIGMNKAIIDNNVLGDKAEIAAKFNAFAADKPQYRGVIEKLDKMVDERKPLTRELTYLTETFFSAIEFQTSPVLLDNIKKALTTGDKKALTGTLSQLKSMYARVHNKDYDHDVDRKVAKAVLPTYAKHVDAANRPDIYAVIEKEFGGNTDAFVDALYSKSILANEANLNAFLQNPTVEAIDNDPGYLLSKSVRMKYGRLATELGKTNADFAMLHKAYIRGLEEMKLPAPSYPDANFTLRLTYGNVKSYDPRDGVHYNYYTTTDGILEKEDPNNPEFVVPAKLKELIKNKDFGPYAMADGTMPVCFLTTNDITGGNSGSPVMDGEGHLIGTAFDGNWESLSGDINFDNDLQRCIVLDIRYVLFILDKLGDCKHLVDEMNVAK